MVVNKYGDRLYQGLVDTETAHLQGVALSVGAVCGGEAFMRALKAEWEAHNKSVHMIRDILMVRRSVAGRGGRGWVAGGGRSESCRRCLAGVSLLSLLGPGSMASRRLAQPGWHCHGAGRS